MRWKSPQSSAKAWMGGAGVSNDWCIRMGTVLSWKENSVNKEYWLRLLNLHYEILKTKTTTTEKLWQIGKVGKFDLFCLKLIWLLRYSYANFLQVQYSCILRFWLLCIVFSETKEIFSLLSAMVLLKVSQTCGDINIICWFVGHLWTLDVEVMKSYGFW